MAAQSVTPEKISYARLCIAITEICAESLRDVILRNIPLGFKDINQAVSFKRPQLQQHLEKYQYSVIFQNNQLHPNFSVSECDMSLLYSLIRNVTSVQPPLLGWGKLFKNNPQDISLGANVERLHKLRNTVIHLKEPRLSNQDFNSHWTEMRKCVADIETVLGGTKYQQRLDQLRTDDMNLEHANRIIETFRNELQLLQAEQHQQGQALLDLKAEQSKGFVEIKANNEQLHYLVQTRTEILPDIKTSVDHQNQNFGEVLDLLKDPERGLCRIAEDVKEMKKKQILYCNNKDGFKGSHELLECGSEETDQKQSQLSSTQAERIENSTSNHDGESENTTDSTKQTVEKTDVDGGSKNGSSAAQVQLKKNDSHTEANQDTIGEKEIGDLASGLDGKLSIIKQYAFIKSNLSRESGLVIAKCLWEQKLLSQDAFDQMGNICCARRHPIDILLKKVVHGNSDEVLGAFFKSLKVECPEIARAVKETKITRTEKLRFIELKRHVIGSKELLPTTNSSIDDRDIKFFQYHLCESEEVVDNIADVLLSRIHLSILDHSIIIGCQSTVEKISALFSTLQSRSLDVASELQGFLNPKLYQEWIHHRRRAGRWASVLRWICSSKSVMNSIFEYEEIEFDEAEIGSIILKFHAGKNFSVNLLNPESLKRNIRILLKRLFLEHETAHVTVYIESPEKKGQEDIHIYINFDTINMPIETEDHQAEMRIRNRNIMSEEMNPARLKQWMFDQPCIQKIHRDMLESKLREHWHSRKEEMTVLLDIIYGLENGNELLEKYCERNDPYVYNKVFRKRQEFHSQEEEMLGQRAAVSYEKGGGLQKLFSFSMTFIDEGEAFIPDQKHTEVWLPTAEDLSRRFVESKPKPEAMLRLMKDKTIRYRKVQQSNSAREYLEVQRSITECVRAEIVREREESRRRMEESLREEKELQLKLEELQLNLKETPRATEESLRKEIVREKEESLRRMEELQLKLEENLREEDEHAREEIVREREESRRLMEESLREEKELQLTLEELQLNLKETPRETEESLRKEIVREKEESVRRMEELQLKLEEPRGFMKEPRGFMKEPRGFMKEPRGFMKEEEDDVEELHLKLAALRRANREIGRDMKERRRNVEELHLKLEEHNPEGLTRSLEVIGMKIMISPEPPAESKEGSKSPTEPLDTSSSPNWALF